MISPKLRKFLKKWLAWAEAGGKGPEFNHDGLCVNVNEFVYDELMSLLKEEPYPFNSSGDDYEKEYAARTAHLNPKRLAWVRKTLVKTKRKPAAKRKAPSKAVARKVLKHAAKEAGKRKDTPTARRIAAAKRGAK